MAISSQMFGFAAECDNCGQEEDLADCEDFPLAVAELKKAGWSVTKTPSSWEHLCPGCTSAQGAFDFEDIS